MTEGVENMVLSDELSLVEPKPLYEFVKRAQDIVMALATLILLFPVWVIIALVVRLSSSGPIIYRQDTAVGRYGRPFTMYKFRTMHAENDNSNHQAAIARFVKGEHLDTIKKDGENVQVYKITRDPRITSIGVFLRKSGLDEIPQIINVLRGELSMVGPRPPLQYEYNHYTEYHKQRLEVLPGITGLYQVTARSQVPFAKMVEIDLDYVQRRSYWLDLKIILRTPWVLLTGMGAY